MITLLKNANVFAPHELGRRHILVADKKIAKLLDVEEPCPEFGKTINLNGASVVPGFVDALAHFSGGGGEGGFGNRTPELSSGDAIHAGVTTLVGALGTDSITRTPAMLLGKCRELNAHGLSAYLYTGSYHLPLKTITQSVENDLLFIPEVLGVGEVALSDHRGSTFCFETFLDTAKTTITSASLAGKKGVVFCHLGDSNSKLAFLEKIISESDVSVDHFIATHQNRNPMLFEAALKFAQQGGHIDFTTSTTPELIADGEVKAAMAIKIALEQGVDISKISMSSDANASLPRFDSQGNTIGVQAGRIESLFEAVVEAYLTFDVPFEQALQTITLNPANALGLYQKGRIEEGGDADFVVLNPQKSKPQQVWSLGQCLLNND